MRTFAIYENSVENSEKVVRFKTTEEMYDELYELLFQYQDKYPITLEQVVGIISWAERATIGDDYVLDDITITAIDDSLCKILKEGE